jgi:hypothetical protein
MAGRHPLAEDADDTDDFYAQLSAAAEQADTAADAAAQPLAPDGSLRSLRQLHEQVGRIGLARCDQPVNRCPPILQSDLRLRRMLTPCTSWWLVVLHWHRRPRPNGRWMTVAGSVEGVGGCHTCRRRCCIARCAARGRRCRAAADSCGVPCYGAVAAAAVAARGRAAAGAGCQQVRVPDCRDAAKSIPLGNCRLL